MHAPAIGSIVKYYYQRMRKWKFFEVVRIRSGKQVFELRNKWKTTVWNLYLDKEMKNLVCQKMRACATGGNTFLVRPENALMEWDMKRNKAVKYEKNEKLTFWMSNWVKKWQTQFKKNACLRHRFKFFYGYNLKRREGDLF